MPGGISTILLMDKQEVKQLVGALKKKAGHPDEISFRETHISWLIFTSHYVYKIKRPLKTSYLDFSTLTKRKYFCEEEIRLNSRTAEDIYMETIPITKNGHAFSLGKENAKIVDYAVKMHKMDDSKQMDILLRKHKVSKKDIYHLAQTISKFHQKVKAVWKENIIRHMIDDMKDIENQKDNFIKLSGEESWDIVKKHIKKDTAFVEDNYNLLQERNGQGFIRDVHGDLHPGNIILESPPVLFDCLEFNADLRQIDVLNELAFLCMELEKNELLPFSGLLYTSYMKHMDWQNTDNEKKLWAFYKRYRCNVRAKVEIRKAAVENEVPAIEEANKYLALLARLLEDM